MAEPGTVQPLLQARPLPWSCFRLSSSTEIKRLRYVSVLGQCCAGLPHARGARRQGGRQGAADHDVRQCPTVIHNQCAGFPNLSTARDISPALPYRVTLERAGGALCRAGQSRARRSITIACLTQEQRLWRRRVRPALPVASRLPPAFPCRVARLCSAPGSTQACSTACSRATAASCS
jgi:hypothetical protein